ncbi:MAG: hypothetical protein ACXVNR_06140, partial [Bacteroidia bacterium]
SHLLRQLRWIGHHSWFNDLGQHRFPERMSDKIKLLVFSAVLFAATLFASRIIELPLYLPIVLTVFFTAFTLVFNSQLDKAYSAENKNKFTQVFLAMTGMKMFASMILLVYILALSSHDKFNLGVCIMTYYMAYTVYEVIHWRSKLTK